MATSPPNRTKCQNNFDNSCTNRAKEWKVQSGMQWNTNWYANLRKAAKTKLHKQLFGEKLIAHRKSPGSIGNCVEQQVQTVCARGIALMFTTNGIMNKKVYSNMMLFGKTKVFLVVDRNTCFIVNNFAQTNTKTRRSLHRCYGNTLSRERLHEKKTN